MANGMDGWKRLDIALKALIAAAGLWATILYHHAQTTAEADRQREQQKADTDQNRLEELRVVKEFFEPLTSTDPVKRRMAAIGIGQLSNKPLVFELAMALPDDERAVTLEVFGWPTANKLLHDQKQTPEVQDNARAAADLSMRGAFVGAAAATTPTPVTTTLKPEAPRSPPAPPVAKPSSLRADSEGFVYIGQWDGQRHVWISHYFEPASHGALMQPHELGGAHLVVPARTGAVYLRADVPDASGHNRPTRGVLQEGYEVNVEQAPLWNTGDKDSGFIWAKVKVVTAK